MTKKIFRITDNDQATLSFLVFHVQNYYMAERARGANLTASSPPTESSIIRALIRYAYPIAQKADAAQREAMASSTGVEIPKIDTREFLFALYEDSALGSDTATPEEPGS